MIHTLKNTLKVSNQEPLAQMGKLPLGLGKEPLSSVDFKSSAFYNLCLF